MKQAFGVATAVPSRLEPLAPGPADAPFHPCNLPIAAALAEELTARPWHGFRFLGHAAYDHALDRDGDLLRTLVFGPDYGHCLLHPASELVLGLRAGSIELHGVARTRTRGRAALAFAAHPQEPLLAYGDNAGDFHAQPFSAEGFGRAGKIAAKGRKASRLVFFDQGSKLMLGGMGYLASFAYEGGKFRPLHETALAVRDFVLLDDGRTVLVNQGMHGIAAYRYDASGFTQVGSTGSPVREILISTDARYLAALIQDSAGVLVYEISEI